MRFKDFLLESYASDLAGYRTSSQVDDAMKKATPVPSHTRASGMSLFGVLTQHGMDHRETDIREIEPHHLPPDNELRQHMEKTGHRFFVAVGKIHGTSHNMPLAGFARHFNMGASSSSTLIGLHPDYITSKSDRHAVLAHEVAHVLTKAKGVKDHTYSQPYQSQRDEHNAFAHGIFSRLQSSDYRAKLKKDMQTHFQTDDLSSVSKSELISKATEHAIAHRGLQRPDGVLTHAFKRPDSVSPKISDQKRVLKGRNRMHARVSRWISYNNYDHLVSKA